MFIPCFLERARNVAGVDPKPAIPAEPMKDFADAMIEEAIRELDLDNPGKEDWSWVSPRMNPGEL